MIETVLQLPVCLMGLFDAGAGIQIAFWTLLFIIVLAVFINIQAYMDNPNRKQIEAEWYKAFSEYRDERYKKNGINWRVEDLSVMWGGLPKQNNGA